MNDHVNELYQAASIDMIGFHACDMSSRIVSISLDSRPDIYQLYQISINSIRTDTHSDVKCLHTDLDTTLVTQTHVLIDTRLYLCRHNTEVVSAY